MKENDISIILEVTEEIIKENSDYYIYGQEMYKNGLNFIEDDELIKSVGIRIKKKLDW